MRHLWDEADAGLPDQPGVVEQAVRRRIFWRRVWRYGTVAVALLALEAADGDTRVFFPVVFGSLFLNWSFFARRRLVRWFGWVASAAVGAAVAWVAAEEAQTSRLFVWAVSGLVGVGLLLGRLALERVFPNPTYWYRLADHPDPF